MRKLKKRKFKFNFIHLQAVVVLVFYFFLSKANVVKALLIEDLFSSFVRIYLFGVVSTFIFIFIFSHEDFLPFAKDIEKSEKEKEKQYLKRFGHFGKIIAAFIIGTIGGPLFIALTLRLFFHKRLIKYPLIFMILFLSTLMLWGVSKGLFH